MSFVFLLRNLAWIYEVHEFLIVALHLLVCLSQNAHFPLVASINASHCSLDKAYLHHILAYLRQFILCNTKGYFRQSNDYFIQLDTQTINLIQCADRNYHWAKDHCNQCEECNRDWNQECQNPPLGCRFQFFA